MRTNREPRNVRLQGQGSNQSTTNVSLKVIVIRKLNVMVMLIGGMLHVFGNQFYFYLSYIVIDLNFHIFIKCLRICHLLGN